MSGSKEWEVVMGPSAWCWGDGSWGGRLLGASLNTETKAKATVAWLQGEYGQVGLARPARCHLCSQRDAYSPRHCRALGVTDEVHSFLDGREAMCPAFSHKQEQAETD